MGEKAFTEVKIINGPKGRNPLESGQCFLQRKEYSMWPPPGHASRNPLESGQCFLPSGKGPTRVLASSKGVAIPSNRVNVSYATPFGVEITMFVESVSQSPRIGSMFLTAPIFFYGL